MPYVLAISIGPVQEFIAAARKTRDLWFGSHMLSEICRATAKALANGGAELVFPPPDAVSAEEPDKAKPAVANKIVAVLPDGTSPTDLTAKAKEEALKKLWSYGEEALKRARSIVDEAAVQAQLGDFLEFYSAWCPMANNDGYASALEQADLLLAGRKALRDFSQSQETDGRPKSSLDGGRQSVLREENRSEWVRHDIKRGEQLDGISIIKRVAEIRRFVSVGRVAVDPLIRRLKNKRPQVLNELNGICEQLANIDCPAVTRFDRSSLRQYADFPYDCQLFHITPETDRDLKEWCGEHPEGALLVDSFAKVLREKALPGIEMPEPYLAVLHADGDRMGAAIRKLTTPEKHRELSSALVKFAEQANEIVTRNSGALVYSGGDDVLAFLPLDTALECARELSQAFRQCTAPVFEGVEGIDNPPTLSVGISINYYSEHLSEMIEWSRQAERAAKKWRNSLAVALHTRTAGEEAVIVSRRWDEKPVESIQLWVTLHRHDALPDRAPFDLRELHRELESFSRALPDSEREGRIRHVLEDEVKRILKRKRGEHGRTELSKDVYSAVVARVSNDLGSLRTAVDEMLIARRLARVEEVAGKRLLSIEEALAALTEGGH